MSQIYNLTSDVTVTSFEMGSTPNLNIISVRSSEKCAKFRFSTLSRCDVIVADVKGRNYMPPPPAAGGWRGGPAATGLSSSFKSEVRLYISKQHEKSGFYVRTPISFNY